MGSQEWIVQRSRVFREIDIGWGANECEFRSTTILPALNEEEEEGALYCGYCSMLYCGY